MGLLSNYWSLDSVIFTIIAILGAYVYMTRKFLYWKKLGVMEIPPTPFIGNFADCLLTKKSAGEFVKDLYDQSANLPYMGFYIFDRPFLLVRDPELIKLIVLRDFNYFTDRFATAHDALSAPNSFFLNNPAWKIIRAKLTPTFTSGKIKNMFELMLRVDEDLKTYLNSLDLEGEGQVLEFKELSSKYSSDVIGITAFGLNVNSLNNPNAEFRKNGNEIFRPCVMRNVEMMSIFFTPQFVKTMGSAFIPKKCEKYLRRIFWDIVDERERLGVRRNDLIDRLMDLKKSETDNSVNDIFEFDGDNLVAQAVSFFNAGYETVSTAISFTLYELALAPNIQTKLRQEIKDALENNNGEITYDLVLSLPYLDMVLSESLRKYPSLPFLDRAANADYKIPDTNLVLEKGTPVYISIQGLHYDPEYFPDPEVFDPERFTNENKKNIKPCTYMPFGDGPRNCIGKRFALLETKLAIIRFLSEYELLPCEKTLIPMRLSPKAFLIAADGGLFLKIRKITTRDD